jgi:hypothetical protein
MVLGPSKYDDILTEAREKSEAKGAILIVFKGKYGSGFACQLPVGTVRVVATILREIADNMAEDDELIEEIDEHITERI